MTEPAFVAPLKAALAAHQQNRVADAKAGYETVLEMAPGQPEALYYLGVINHAEGMLEAAEKRIAESFKRVPRAEVGYNLSRILTEREKPKAAMRTLRAVLKLAPTHANAAFDLGLLLRKADDSEGAIQAYEPALNSPVHAAAAMMNIGLCYQDLGDLDAAREWYQKNLQLQPLNAEALSQIAFVSKFKEADDAHITQMREAYDTCENDDDRCVLAFALGKAMDDLKDYEQAFKYYKEGNKLKRRKYPLFSMNATRESLLTLLDFYDPDYLQQAEMASVEGDERMLFVLGMPRSGSTLVEQIISSHSDVYGAGELDTLQHILTREVDGNITTPLEQKKLNSIAAQYLADIEERSPDDARFVVDKALNNNHCIPLMAQLFPRAKFIYCNRDAMDNCVAIYRQNFLGAYPYAYDLKEIGSYYKLNETLINRYREVVPDERFHTIDYEVLVDNPEEEIRKLLAFCELEWQDNCLHFHKADRAVKTASAAQVRKPIYRSSVNSWKRYGDNLQPLQKILGSS